MTRSLLPLLRIIRLYWGRVLFSILLGIATICAGVGLLSTSAYLISSAALHPSIADLQIAIVGVRFFGLFRAVLRYLERLVSHSVNLRILSRLRSDLYSQIEPGAPANLHPQRSGDLLERVIGDLDTLENFFVRVFAPGITAAVLTIGLSLFLGEYGVQIGIILGAGLFINGFIIPVTGILFSSKYAKSLSLDKANYSAASVEFLQGLEDLTANGVEEDWLEKMGSIQREMGEKQLALNRLGTGFSSTSLLAMNLTVLAALTAAIPLVNQSELSGVMLAVVLLFVTSSFEATASMPQAAQYFASSREAAKRLFEFGQEGNPVPENEDPKQEKRPYLKLSRLSFRYPGEEHNVLENFNLTLEKGQIRAIIGLSGSGKSTLFDLLMGFYQPSEGEILLNERTNTEFGVDHWRKHFGMVGQSVYLFNTTIRENLLLADPSAEDVKLLNVLNQAGLSDWFAGQVEGLDTWIGEHGLRISAGERQRLGIARVLLLDPDFILLDEPTANLDPINEKMIFSTLRSVFQQKGILLVTHRLDLLHDVDEVLVLKRGKIVDRGNPVELLARDGIYKNMLSIQKETMAFSFPDFDEYQSL
jgi:ATP-binding cassette subfamily C protein CydC